MATTEAATRRRISLYGAIAVHALTLPWWLLVWGFPIADSMSGLHPPDSRIRLEATALLALGFALWTGVLVALVLGWRKGHVMLWVYPLVAAALTWFPFHFAIVVLEKVAPD